MADVKIVELQVKTNIDSAATNVDKLKTGLKSATTESNNLSQSMSGGKASEFINTLGDSVGKLNPAFGAAVKGSNGLLLKMWELVANPIGAILAAIVVTLKFLYESFQSSVAGGKELKAVFAAISAIGTQVKDAMFGLGRALIDVASAAYKFITLDFKGAAEDMKKANKEATESYKQLGNAVDGTTAKIMYNLEKQQQANDKARKMQAVTQSETNKLLVKSRETLTDETASLKDKKKALEEVTKAETASSKEKVRIAAEDLRIAQAKAKGLGGEEEKKAKQELRELTIALNEAETENAMTGIKLNKQKKMLSRQEMADAKEAADAQKEITKSKTEAAKKAHDDDKQILDEKLRQEGLNFQQRRDLVAKDKLLTKAERDKYNEQINKEEKKSIEEHKKAVEDLEKSYITRAEDAAANTDQKKLDLEMSRQKKVIESTAKTEEEKAKLLDYWQSEYDRKQKELTDKTATEAAAKKTAELDKIIADKELSSEERLKAIDEEQLLLQQQFDNKLLTEQQYNDKVKGLAKARITIGDEEAKAKMEQLQRGSALLSNIGGLLGKSTAAGKAAAVASATIDTYAAATTAFKNAQANPISILGPAYPFIQAGLAIAGGLKNVQAILAVETPSGGGGGSAPTASSMGSAAPSFNVVGQGGTNQLAQSIAGQEQQPLKAYVVSNDVTTSQSLDRNIVNNASIG